jgi:hypothetical protein
MRINGRKEGRKDYTPIFGVIGVHAKGERNARKIAGGKEVRKGRKEGKEVKEGRK